MDLARLNRVTTLYRGLGPLAPHLSTLGVLGAAVLLWHIDGVAPRAPPGPRRVVHPFLENDALPPWILIRHLLRLLLLVS